MPASAKEQERVIGRAPERLTLEERIQLTGKYVALEVYTPATLPFRRIEAIGDTIEQCVSMLKSRGLDPTIFEYSRLGPPY